MGCFFRDLAFVCMHVCISSSWLPSQRRKLNHDNLILEVYLDLAPTKIISHTVIMYISPVHYSNGSHTVTKLANSYNQELMSRLLLQYIPSWLLISARRYIATIQFCHCSVYIQPAPLVTIIFSNFFFKFGELLL